MITHFSPVYKFRMTVSLRGKMTIQNYKKILLKNLTNFEKYLTDLRIRELLEILRWIIE